MYKTKWFANVEQIAKFLNDNPKRKFVGMVQPKYSQTVTLLYTEEDEDTDVITGVLESNEF